MSEQQQDNDGIVDDTVLLDHHQLNTNAREWIPSALRQEEEKKAAAAAVVSTLKVGKEFIPSGRYSTTTKESDASNNVMATTRYPKNNTDGAVVDGSRSDYSPSNDSPLTLYRKEYRTRRSTIHSLGCEELLWNYYRQATFDTLREMDPSDPLRKAVPTNFVNIYCLDRTTTTTTTTTNNLHPKTAPVAGTFGYPSHVFKVVSTEDGCVYCLRRFDNTKLSHRIAATVTERWASVAHPGICTLHQCFLSQRAGFFLHEYCRGSSTTSMTQFYQLSPTFTTTNTTTTNTISERLLWSYIVQLTSILRYLHARGLACRSLHPNHVLLTDAGHSRIRLSCCGILDALEFEARKSIAELQQEDIRNLGRLLLSIATTTQITSTTNATTLQLCEAVLVQRFSSDVCTLVRALLYSGTNPSTTSSSLGTSTTAYGIPPHPQLLTLQSLCSMISHRVWDELDRAHTVADAYSEELSKCYDNTRALRLLIKLGWINERPEFGMDTQWSETGDRYVIKLFRDYVFHQAREDGSPVLDLGHIITSLNKLDAADPEKIVLVSREGESLLVVSYADIARCVEEAYDELCSADTQLGLSTSATTSTVGDVPPRRRPTRTMSPLLSSSGIPRNHATKTTNTTTIHSWTTPSPLGPHQRHQNVTQQPMYPAVRSLPSSHPLPIPMSQQQEHTMGYRGENIW